MFVDLGGVEGLIHISELSWGRVQHPNNIVDIGQVVKTQVLSINSEIGRVALSMKQLFENPWEIIVNKYNPGDIINVWVTTITHFGVFARLEEGVEGLIHISSIKLPSGESDLKRLFSPNQQLTARILHIDAGRRRLGLGLVYPE